MARPRLLDLGCKAGGASYGYWLAGYEPVGVDIKPQPRYPFEFIQADMMTIDLEPYDLIHASPPCQDHTRQYVPRTHGTGWMVGAIRERLKASGTPWVLENVPGAPMQPNLILCGCVVGLADLERERWFETSPAVFELRPPCHHERPVISITGNGTPTGTWRVYGSVSLARAREVMGIGWMTRRELSQAIPPAYTEYIGGLLLEVVGLKTPGERTPGAVPDRGTACQLQPKPPGSLSRGAGRAIMASPYTFRIITGATDRG
jgi:DNA (cytosine-5)-methyltransferase 1